MDEKIPEPLSKPVEPTKPGANVPPASAAPSSTVSSTPMGMPASNVGKSGGGKKVLLTLLILLLIGAAGAFGYLWWQQKQTVDAQKAELQADIEAAEKKATEAETKVKELEEAQTSEAETTKTDEELITEAAQNYASAMVDGANSKIGKPELFTNKNFASVTYADANNEGGGIIILKKSNNAWIVVTSGQSVDEQAYATFGIPKQ